MSVACPVPVRYLAVPDRDVCGDVRRASAPWPAPGRRLSPLCTAVPGLRQRQLGRTPERGPSAGVPGLPQRQLGRTPERGPSAGVPGGWLGSRATERPEAGRRFEANGTATASAVPCRSFERPRGPMGGHEGPQRTHGSERRVDWQSAARRQRPGIRAEGGRARTVAGTRRIRGRERANDAGPTARHHRRRRPVRMPESVCREQDALAEPRDRFPQSGVDGMARPLPRRRR